MESRTEIRHGLQYRLNIISARGDEHFGHVINLSQSGMMIRSNNQVTEGESLTVRLIVSDDPDQQDSIPVIMRVCWTKPKGKSGMNVVGCRIEDIPSLYQQRYQNLLSDIAGRHIVAQ